jgi:hypothetical protein
LRLQRSLFRTGMIRQQQPDHAAFLSAARTRICGEPARDLKKIAIAFLPGVPQFQHAHGRDECIAVASPERPQFAVSASHDRLTFRTLADGAMRRLGHHDLCEVQSA